MTGRSRAAIATALLGPWLAILPAHAKPAWSLRGQATFVYQYHPAFHAAYSGANSLSPASRGNETFDATLFLGARLWHGGSVHADPEVDQGFGLSNTLGVAGFPSGEAYKVGQSIPYLRLQRLFFRQSFTFGTPDASSRLSDGKPAPAPNKVVITLGKFAVTDIFDTDWYAHDARTNFLNWSLIDTGTFDYAADAWGYTYGGAVEWTHHWWTLRTGLFDLSRVPNSSQLVRGFGQYEVVGEFEGRYHLNGLPGQAKITGFVNDGRMGSYLDALALARATHTIPSTALVRKRGSRTGVSIDVDQQVTHSLGLFLRAGINDGSKETYEFTEINRTVAVGLSLKGLDWNRPHDTVGAAFVVNGLSRQARAYFAAGGLGLLIGDGRLNYSTEDIFESYYSARLNSWLTASFDYQFILHPAYNRARGPVHIFALRLHIAT